MDDEDFLEEAAKFLLVLLKVVAGLFFFLDLLLMSMDRSQL